MSNLEILLLVFGILFLIYLINQRNEKFTPISSLGRQKNISECGEDYGLVPPHPDLIREMKPVLENERLERERGINDFQREESSAMNIVNYYPTEREIPYDITRHDYKLEKDPRKIIDEMKAAGENMELRNVYNNSVKNYKTITPEKQTEDQMLLDISQVQYEYLDKEKNVKTEDIMPINQLSANYSNF